MPCDLIFWRPPAGSKRFMPLEDLSQLLERDARPVSVPPLEQVGRTACDGASPRPLSCRVVDYTKYGNR